MGAGVRFCKVLSIDDDTDADRIKVRLLPEDNSIKETKDLEYVFPLLPKVFHVKPKVGEAVLVLLAKNENGNSQRYYIGPIISQDHRITEDTFFAGADRFLRGSYDKFDVAPRMNPDIRDLLPGDDEVWVRGRKNADIQVTDNDVRIKAGVKLHDEGDKYKISFNPGHAGYIKTKYHLNPLNGDVKSTTSIVSDKILLLSNNSPKYTFENDRKELIDDKTYNDILSKAYRLPYGELLIDFLNTFVNMFITHTHPFPMLPPNPVFTEPLISKKATMLDKKEMLSDTVRIN